MTPININFEQLQNLDLSPVQKVIEPLLQESITQYEQQLRFEISFSRDESDPRELSEIPEVRLWFVRLDAYYPWLPFLLDWKGRGIESLCRYVGSPSIQPQRRHSVQSRSVRNLCDAENFCTHQLAATAGNILSISSPGNGSNLWLRH